VPSATYMSIPDMSLPTGGPPPCESRGFNMVLWIVGVVQ
jgi:hypothetical protein